MRRRLDWFANQVSRTWRAVPGRSFMLLVPHACNDVDIARSIKEWLIAEFRPPAHSANFKTVAISVASDSTSSSQQFVDRVVRALASEIQGFDFERSGYPSDDLENAIGESHAHEVYPVLLIERFHGFARVADEHLLSVLSRLRELEHRFAITTLAISPLEYHQLRRELDRAGKFPFVNSSYGDNHDRAVLTPITRDEFVAEANARGIAEREANRYFSHVCGPDALAVAALDVLCDGPSDGAFIEGTVRRLGDRLDGFMRFSLNELEDNASEVLGRLALGTNTPPEREYLRSLPIFPFLAREEKTGQVACASSLLGRVILKRMHGPMGVYNACLNSLAIGNYAAAAQALDGHIGEEAHLQAFAGLVRILAAIYDENDPGLMGINWHSVARQASVLQENLAVWPKHREWVIQLERLSRRALKATKGVGRAKMADLTVEARDDEALAAILFSTTVYSAQVSKRPSPRDRVLALSSMPETALQAIAAAFCGFSHTSAPESLEDAPYGQFFGRDNYRHPDKGSKLDLTGLLVLVPIHLRIRFPNDDIVASFCEPKKVVSIMGKLVDQIRNVTAHTYGVFTDADAAFAQQVSSELLDLLAHLAGHGNASAFVSSLGQPTLDELDQLLGGAIAPTTEVETI